MVYCLLVRSLRGAATASSRDRFHRLLHRLCVGYDSAGRDMVAKTADARVPAGRHQIFAIEHVRSRVTAPRAAVSAHWCAVVRALGFSRKMVPAAVLCGGWAWCWWWCWPEMHVDRQDHRHKTDVLATGRERGV